MAQKGADTPFLMKRPASKQADESCRPHILIVEDSFALAETYRAYLKADGYEVTCVETGKEAMDFVQNKPPQIIILDVHLPDANGIDVLIDLKNQQIASDVIMVTGQASINLAVDAMREGAVDFLMKPFAAERLRVTVRNALEKRALETKIHEIEQKFNRDRFFGFIGRSPAMQVVYQTIENAARSDVTVFIRGESGTGKELCAEALHQMSLRRDRPFVTLNCAAIPGDLLESEIFGHVKGAFTGALHDRKGAAMRSNGGTLFLDEICEMDVGLQSKLLRFIQEQKVQPVGGDVSFKTDIRIICATNQDPLAAVKAGRFREDLFYRLHVVPITLPALCERGEDIVLIAQHFLDTFANQENKTFTGFVPEALEVLLAYSWPGNVRQLQNLMQQIVVMQDGGLVEAFMLGEDVVNQKGAKPTDGLSSYDEDSPSEAPLPSAATRGDEQEGNPLATGNPVTDCLLASLGSSTQALETAVVKKMSEHPPEIKPLEKVIRETIETAIAAFDGSIPQAAAALDVSPSTLYRRLQAWEREDTLREEPDLFANFG